ncbi:RIP metalloprotease RseP [Vacuolonema iberomarrocanum]|uniref:RIP metalloprotease RseP n=1 Tax=Vacuolonema iberomarrocanum TaxID=3454632 RepID=UPI0019E1A644|nr:RIP metalloprotease RseP [filamentous cyanobacterium LEGE 07170]
MSVFAAIAVLGLLVAVHELGHFLAARLQGIHVNRFSIGFGPVVLKYQGAETEYALRAFPLGGFVGFPDDDPDSNIPANDPDLMQNRPIMDRAIVISAGVIANLIFAYLVFVTQAGVIGIQEINLEPGVAVPQVIAADAPAAQAGLQNGDVVIAVNGQTLGTGEPAERVFMDAIQSSPNQSIDLQVNRDGTAIDLQVTPRIEDDGTARIGALLAPNGSVDFRRPNGVGEIFSNAARDFQRMFLRIVGGFVTLITNFSSVAGQVAGPVKIVEQGASLASDNIGYLFPFTALISINLAIINILPLPALDGGQLAFLLIEAARGKPLPTRFQENVMQTGLMVLLGLGIFLIVRDTTQLDAVQRLFQQ